MKIKLNDKNIENFTAWINSIDASSIEELDFSGSAICDEDLASISGEMKNLRMLDLSNTKVSDLSCLIYMPNLEELDISCTDVKHIEYLEDLHWLKRVDAYDTAIADLSPLEELELEKLMIGYAQVSDLAPLAKMKALVKIDLNGNSDIRDLSPLNELKNLEALSLKQIPIVPDELNHLMSLPHLRAVHVSPELEFAAKAVMRSIEKNQSSSYRCSQRVFSLSETSKFEKSPKIAEKNIQSAVLSKDFQDGLIDFSEKKDFPSPM